MKLWRLLSASGLVALSATSAFAQVSVPLPRARPASPPPTSTTGQQPPSQGTSVPLPGSRPTTPDINTLPTVGQSGTSALPIGKYGRPDINPYDRDLDMTVPLMFKGRSLGDLPIRLTYDDRLLVDRKAFEAFIGPLLNAKAKAALTAAGNGLDRYESDSLKALGISFEYDPSSLAVVVLTIDPSQRSLQRLFAIDNPGDDRPDLMPATFAGFLNLDTFYSYSWEDPSRNGPPTVAFNGALRYAGIVFEGDAQVGRSGFGGPGDPYAFSRNYARLVYDQPKDYRRWYLGDLTPEVRGQQGYVQIGGIGVSRQRQRFDPYRSSILQGNRQLVLQRDATVRIMRNGVPYRELQLDAGSYDFSSLPLLAGSNDVQIEVRDITGNVQNIAYSQYLDPIDLVPGDYEYSAYFGPTSNNFGRNPRYNGPVAFSGFYRKAFISAPAIGIGLQASRDVQTLTGQTQFVLPGGSRLLFDGGVSHSRAVGTGFSAGLGYDLLIDRAGLVDSASLRVDYLSRRYAFLSSPIPNNTTGLSVNGQYTRQIDPKLSLLLIATYLQTRGRSDNYRIATQANYFIDRNFSIRAGVEYSRIDSILGSGRGFGFSIALVYQPNVRDRVEARHQSVTETSSLSYNHSSSNRIGSLGYGGVVQREGDALSGQAFADYLANRFDASISHISYGPNLRRFGTTNVSTVRVGTSLAFADGVFGIGRRVTDSFALLYPHENLAGRHVVAGQSLANNDYLSKSGALGAAVNGYLNSYVVQPIQYDIENPPPGYDIGTGSVRVKPPYHSGYKLKVGTDAFASAMGTLVMPDGKPVSLAGGHVTATDGKDKESLPFFTNSVGRFAIANLRPGVTYRVELEQGTRFEFSVPKDTTGLVDLKTVSLSTTQ